jgi:outer membrane protein
MRKIFFFLFVLPFATCAYSQFGYYSTSRVLEALPQYAKAVNEYERLCTRCEKEISHNQKELTRQYVAFLDGHRDFPEPILRKRQSELQRLVDNSVAFRKELKVWLVQAKDSLYAPSYQILDEALVKVCVACDLDYAIDSDILAYRYINPNKGVDITRMVIDAALHPDKPITDIDGYEDYVRQYKPVVALPASDDANGATEITIESTPAVEGTAAEEWWQNTSLNDSIQ